MSADKSEIFFWFLAGILAGVALGSFIRVPVFFIAGILFLAAFFSARGIFEKKALPRTIPRGDLRGLQILAAAVFMGISLGLYRWHGVIRLESLPSLPVGERVHFSAMVLEPPERRDLSSKLVLSVREINGIRLREAIRVLATSRRFAPYEYGDMLAGIGVFEKPFDPFNNAQGRPESYRTGDLAQGKPASGGEFDYAKYLAKEGIYYIMRYPPLVLQSRGQGSFVKQILFSVRDRFELAIDRALPEPQASLASGILLGKARSFPEDFSEALRKTSTIHIVAVSGYNLTIVAKTIMGALLLFTISRRFSFWIAVFAIIVFTILVGAPSSAVRAAIMGILLLVAQQAGRISSAKNALAFAASAMVMVNPKIFRWDLGFQLSFLAMFGIIYLSPILREKLTFWRNIFGFRDIVADTTGAQLVVAPWILFKFGTISLVGLLANILVLPVIPLSMFWSFIVGIAGNISGALGIATAAVPAVLLGYAVFIIEFFSRFPASLVTIGGTPIAFVAIVYAIIFFLIARKYRNVTEVRLP